MQLVGLFQIMHFRPCISNRIQSFDFHWNGFCMHCNSGIKCAKERNYLSNVQNSGLYMRIRHFFVLLQAFVFHIIDMLFIIDVFLECFTRTFPKTYPNNYIQDVENSNWFPNKLLDWYRINVNHYCSLILRNYRLRNL